MQQEVPLRDTLRPPGRGLRARLKAAEETLRAIHADEVDALVVGPAGSEQIYPLRGGDESYRVFVEAMAQGAATIDANGTILYCNPCFAEMLCYPIVEVIGSSIYRFVAPDAEGLLRAMLWEGLSTSVRQEFKLLARGAGEVPFHLTVNPLSLEGTNLVCLLATDLSESRARAAAESANRAKDDFLATISHELRTPVGAVLLWSKLLKAGMLGEKEEAAALDTIIRCAKEQSRLVEDLLHASRIAHDKVQLEPLPVELSAVVKATVETLAPIAEEKGVKITASAVKSGLVVMGDAVWLRQAVSNLLSNAIKFTPANGSVEVRLGRRGREASIEVADTGDGIPPELLPRVFDRFWQADTSITRKYGGLGLGLSIVKSIAERHGGSVCARSEGVGQGAAFTITLPLPSRGTTRIKRKGQPAGARDEDNAMFADERRNAEC
ncbi:MAG: two-component hybrid sensor and regulator [Phycisphaerales bacterium]|nr:two-component hybrid sensor and regulator [Phycisphaerales bacterium]